MQVIYLESNEAPSADTLRRSASSDAETASAVAKIIAGVRERGDEALRDYTREFDNVDVENTRVMVPDIQAVLRKVDKQVLEALEVAARNIVAFHEQQLERSWFDSRSDGSLVGSKVTPLDSVGIYVPGGRALYPSTVLMNALPARVAGVRRIAMVSPPQKDGSLDPVLLAAAHIAGVTEVHAVGGAQAIAALAYGTKKIAAVDKITGPGNAYVAAAKRQVAGDVGIDMVAGPSEVLILADESAEPALVALDLMAQAEHDPLAACYLVTTDEELVEEVLEEIDAFMADSPRAEVTRTSLDDNGIAFVVPDLATALLAVNTIAPEHLEVHMDNPIDLLGLIDNAGAIFLGPWTPESVGDYIAGPNHTLPTGGTARFSSPLSTADFIKRSSVISYSYTALLKDAPAITALAEKEGLWAHGKAVSARFELLEDDDDDLADDDDAGEGGDKD
ncbi:MAG: histidinol dehydrogenase [Coriobacteriales bacterium]|jgi:histidinol dehydrogenase|nr:histidinol dehydrogenase [Coriobacteriales bacterium]